MDSYEDAGYADNVGYTEYHNDGDGGGGGPASKSSSACCLMMLGIVLFPLSLFVLGWNEKNSVCQGHIIMEAEDSAVVGECGSDGASAAEGKFTFYSCPVDDKSLVELTPSSSFNTPGLAQLINFKSVAGSQKIEMYQCIETKEDVKKAQADRDRTDTVSEDDESALQKDDETKEEAKVGHKHYRKGAIKSEEGGQILSVTAEGALKRHGGVVRSEESATASRRRRTNTQKTESATVYKYKMGWTDAHYKSEDFKATPSNIQSAGCPDFVYNGQVNQNPAVPDRGDGEPAELGRQFVTVPTLIAGGYTLSDETELKKLTADEAITLTPFAESFGLAEGTDNIVTTIGKSTVAVHAESPTYLSSCRSDRLGCVRISYNKSDVTHISVLGLTGGSGVMSPNPIEARWGCDAVNYIRMEPNEMTKEELIALMKMEKEMTTWMFRVGGLLVAWLALYCCFQPVATAADMAGDVLAYVPFVGESMESALEGVVEMFLCIVSCGFGMSCGLFVIAIVWLGMRPMVGAPLMGGVLVLFIVGYCALKKADRDPSRMRKGKFAQQQPYQQQYAPPAEY